MSRFAQDRTNDNRLITIRIEPDGRILRIGGRAGWFLRKLIGFGKRGCTPADFPAGLRLAHYAYLLRREGLIIETEHEAHGGDYPGHHARYRLRTEVTEIAAEGVAA